MITNANTGINLCPLYIHIDGRTDWADGRTSTCWGSMGWGLSNNSNKTAHHFS